MKRYDEQDPWALLGLTPEATVGEIRRAYERLSTALAPGSLALYSVADSEEQRRIQRALHVAYLRLLRAAGAEIPAVPPAHAGPPEHPTPAPQPGREPRTQQAPVPPAPPPPLIEATTDITGELLRRLRESRRLSLDDVARRTRVRRVHLESLENEDFPALPERVFTRGFVHAYARELGVDPERAWSCIEPRFLSARPPQELKFPV
jgi:hypothetical protein